MRGLKNISVLLACIVCFWLSSTTAFAAPRPQDSAKRDDTTPAKQNEAAPAKQADEPSKEDLSKETSNAVAGSYEFSATSRHSFSRLPSDFFLDQKEIWTSPAKLRLSDTQWLVPLSGITAGLFVTDRDFSKHLSQNPTTISHYKTLSNAGVGALIGGGAGMWLLGHASHNEHWSETGFLAGEAALNSLVVVESMKYSLQRERPYQGNGSGSFFQGGGTSFPSEHSAAAWSIAGVVAHEYPGPLAKIFAYGLASLVDISRVRARQHYPSDVLIGSVIGNLVAQNIYSRHHDPELGGEAWRSISSIFRGDGSHSPANQGSPYVPLDSWIYPALDRLAAMGLIDSGIAGMRPWTRNECARLLGEAEDKVGEVEGRPEVHNILSVLEEEFRSETEAAGGGRGEGTFRVESLYSRTEHISGKPLNDGYDFGQTQINDFGRPYSEGWNNVSGFSTYATSGSWAGYVRAELQTAPSIPALPLSARQFVAASDGFPTVAPGTASPSVQRFDLLEAYAGLTFDNWAISFGKQSLDWGPGDGGAMMLSNNAEPINMFRIDRVSPFALPSFLKFLGPVRMEFFVGQLGGHHFVNTAAGTTVGSWSQPLNPQPLIDGAKFSFKPSSNLEVGLTYGTMFGGVGVPATLHTFAQALFNTGELPGGRSLSIRWNTLDFTYRIPKLRKWLTLYGEGIAEDQFVFFIDQTASPLPFGYPDRAVWRAGIYVPRLPRLSKLDFRVEGVYTDNPNVGDSGNISDGYYYRANRYLNGFTNNGFLLGSWVGRQGQGAQAWTNYWLSPRNRLQLNFRHQKVSQQFVPGGGTLTDVGARADYWLRSNLGLSASVQYERWLFPIIQPGAERNVSATIEIQFQPQKLFGSSMFRLAPKDASGGNTN